MKRSKSPLSDPAIAGVSRRLLLHCVRSVVGGVHSWAKVFSDTMREFGCGLSDLLYDVWLVGWNAEGAYMAYVVKVIDSYCRSLRLSFR